MRYDVDIAVVGAGPAGLAAALRARWLRTYKALPASVALIDPAGKGGLANWRTVLMTGPSFALDLSTILDDIEMYPVKFIQSAATGADLNGPIKVVRTEAGELTCRAVIVCTGLKTLANERDYVDRGLMMTLKDHNFMADVLERFCEEHRGKRLLVWGTQRAAKTVRFVESISRGRLEIASFLEEEDAGPVRGVLRRINGKEWIESVTVADEQGLERDIATDFLLLDFESHMLRTNSAAAFPELQRRDGFIEVDHFLRTSIPGVYAAGDITGGPFCGAKAIGEGVSAGFYAYQQVYQDKFGTEPSLYAFFPHRGEEIVVGETGFRIPPLTDDMRPKILMPADVLEPLLDGADMAPVLTMMDGATTMHEILVATGLNMDAVAWAVDILVERKALALHV